MSFLKRLDGRIHLVAVSLSQSLQAKKKGIVENGASEVVFGEKLFRLLSGGFQDEKFVTDAETVVLGENLKAGAAEDAAQFPTRKEA